MKKAELEAKILELDKKIAVLEARPVCYGHYCNYNHVCNLPHYPSTPYQPFPSGPTWVLSSGAAGGLSGENVGTVKFGNIS
jgi:hypothetical protein